MRSNSAVRPTCARIVHGRGDSAAPVSSRTYRFTPIPAPALAPSPHRKPVASAADAPYPAKRLLNPRPSPASAAFPCSKSDRVARRTFKISAALDTLRPNASTISVLTKSPDGPILHRHSR